MAKAWSEVAASPAYQALPPDQQSAARNQYFSQVVAPQISDPAQQQAAKAQFDAQYGGPQAAGPAAPAPQADPTFMQRAGQFGSDLGQAFAHNLAKVATGPAQLVGHGITAAADAILPEGNSVRQAIDTTGQNYDANLQNNEQQYQVAVPDNVASYTGAALGNVLPWAVGGGALRAAGAIPQAASLMGRIGTAALEGGVMGAAQPVTNTAGGFAGQKAQQVGTGLAIGGAIPAIGGIPRAIVGTVDPVKQELAQKAAKYGIDITAPQVTTSVPMKVANSVTSQFPFSGAQSFAAKQSGQFNDAVAQKIGLPAGTKKITPDVFNEAYEKASSGFNQLWAGNHLPVGGDLLSKIVPIANEAASYGSADSAGDALNATIDRLVTLANKNGGQVPGRAFQNIDTLLGNTVKNGGTAGHYAGEMQDALRNAMQDNMSPADASQLQNLRQTWQNIKQLAPIVAKQTDGNIPPNALMGAITSNGAGKNAMSRGLRGSMGDLAQIGKGLLGNTYQDSGTGARVAAFDTMKALGGVAAGAGTGTLAPLAGATAGARAIQQALRSRMLYNALAGQTQSAPGLGGGVVSRLSMPLAVDSQMPQFQPQQAQQMQLNPLSGIRRQ